MRYLEIDDFLIRRVNDHGAILQNGTDFASLTMALQKLPNLSEFILNHNWRYCMPPKFHPVLPKTVQPGAGWDSFERHLSASLQAIRLSHLIHPVTSFELSFWPIEGPSLNFRVDQSQIHLMQLAFAAIQSLTLRESEALLLFEHYVKNIDMPELQKLVLDFDEDEIDLSDLQQFCKRNGRHLQELVLSSNMCGNGNDVGNTYVCDPPLAMCYPLYRIGQYCSLRKAHCRLYPWYLQSDRLEALLLRKIALEDIPHVFQKKN